MPKKLNLNFFIFFYIFLIGTVILITPVFSFADVVISEIMYDPKDADTTSGGEWIEVHNTGTSSVDLTQWFFFENKTNHGITADSASEIPAGGYAVISSNLTVFKNFFTIYSGLLFKASFSLNDGEHLGLKNQKDGPEVNSVEYTSDLGAKNDGNSLQLVSGNWIANIPTPGSINVSAPADSSSSNDSSSPSSDSSSNSANQDSSSNSSSSGSTASSVPVEPQIFTSIAADKTATVGVETIFQGATIGLKKEPIDNARYLWSFGDGAIVEGQSVVHRYFEPGEYLVILNTGSGKYSASSRQTIKVLPLGISITKVSGGEAGYISLKNSLSDEINISRWILRSAGKTFIFPSPTIILAGVSVSFHTEITGISADPNQTELFYPNGTLATKFDPPKELKLSSTIAPMPKTILPSNNLTDEAFSASVKTDLTENTIATTAKDNLLTAQPTEVSSSTLIYVAAVSGIGGSANYIDWLLALFGLAGIGAVGVLSSKIKKVEVLSSESVNNLSDRTDPKSLTAEDFEIIEEHDTKT